MKQILNILIAFSFMFMFEQKKSWFLTFIIQIRVLEQHVENSNIFNRSADRN